MLVSPERVWIVRIVGILTIIICVACLVLYLLTNKSGDDSKIKKNRCGCVGLLDIGNGINCSTAGVNNQTDVEWRQTNSSNAEETNFWIDVFATKTSDKYWVLISPEEKVISFEKKDCRKLDNCPYAKFYLNGSQVLEAHQFLGSCIIVDKCNIYGWPNVQRKNCTLTVAMRLSKLEFCLSSNHSLLFGHYEHLPLNIDSVNLLYISEVYFRKK